MPAKKLITKEMILGAALKLLEQKGFEAVTVKSLAAELGCSTQPVYLSFSGMEELRKELIPISVTEFEKIMRAESKKDRICLYGMEYIQLAKREPHLFRFLFMRSHAYEETKRMLYPSIETSIEELMHTYRISHEEADRLHDHLWMHTHGIAAMIATDFCDWNLEKVEEMLEVCKAAFTEKYEV